MRVRLGANGPEFNINKKDVLTLERIGFIDLIKKGINARISLTDHDPNQLKCRNGVILKKDSFCISGYRISRFPEDCCPFDAEQLFYVLRISKKSFDEFLTSNPVYTHDVFDGERHVDSRCKYDRFSLHYTP